MSVWTSFSISLVVELLLVTSNLLDDHFEDQWMADLCSFGNKEHDKSQDEDKLHTEPSFPNKWKTKYGKLAQTIFCIA